MKDLTELELGDIIYVYSIATFPDKEVMTKFSAKVYKVNKTYKTASIYENYESDYQIRRIIKMNEGIVFRNLIWLTKEDDELAKEILLNHYNRKIEILENEISIYQTRIGMINEFFESEDK